MQKEIEIIKDGLSYNEELECIAKRFGMTLTEELYLMITVAESLTYLIVIPLSKMQTEVSMKQNHEFINFRLLVFCYA